MADRKRFEQLALPHLKSVYRTALAMCGQPAKAEDLAQTAFLKAFEKFDSFRPDTNCRAWLLRILRNTWIDELRHRKVVGPSVPVDERLLPGEQDESSEPDGSDPHEILEAFSDEQVIHALQELPEQQRTTLYLVDVEQMPHEEVAEILDVAVGTIKSRASRARSVLKEKLWAHAKDLGFLGRES